MQYLFQVLILTRNANPHEVDILYNTISKYMSKTRKVGDLLDGGYIFNGGVEEFNQVETGLVIELKNVTKDFPNLRVKIIGSEVTGKLINDTYQNGKNTNIPPY